MKKNNSEDKIEKKDFRAYTKRHLDNENPFRKNIRKKMNRNFFGSWLLNLNVVGWLIIVNVLLFIIFALLGTLSNEDCSKTICRFIALQPSSIMHGSYLWTLLTSMFMHSGVFHLFVNMFSLYFIGNFLETIIGRKRFFWLYILSGIFAGLFFCVLAFFFGNSDFGARIFGNPLEFALGASGALFGVVGTLALLTPKNKVYLIAGPLIAIILEVFIGNFVKQNSILNIIDLFVTIYIFIAIFSMLSINYNLRKISLPIEMPFWILPIAAIIPLLIVGFFVELPIGNMAHLGGLLAGIAYGVYLRIRYKKKTQMIANYFCK